MARATFSEPVTFIHEVLPKSIIKFHHKHSQWSYILCISKCLVRVELMKKNLRVWWFCKWCIFIYKAVSDFSTWQVHYYWKTLTKPVRENKVNVNTYFQFGIQQHLTVGTWSMVRPLEHSSNISDNNCTTALTQLWNIWRSAVQESYSMKLNGLNNSQCFVIWRFCMWTDRQW